MSDRKYRGGRIPWAELDKGIVPAIRVIYSAGFEPFASCQGGDGHMADRAFINIEPGARPIEDVASEVAWALADAGYEGFSVGQVANHQASGNPWMQVPPFVCVEFWGEPVPETPEHVYTCDHSEEQIREAMAERCPACLLEHSRPATPKEPEPADEVADAAIDAGFDAVIEHERPATESEEAGERCHEGKECPPNQATCLGCPDHPESPPEQGET